MRLLWPAVAAACIVAVIVFTNRPRESPAPPTYSISAPAIEVTGTLTRLFESPLLTEAQNLSSDARSGIRFLVACLVIEPPGSGVTTQIEQSGPPPVQ